METIGLRLKKYLEHKEVPRNIFCDTIGMKYNSLSRIINGSAAMNSDTLDRIFTYFPDLNARWFITGKGPMEYTAASYHLDPVLEQSHDTMKEVDEYIKNLSEEDIKRLEEQGVKVKFEDENIDPLGLDEEETEKLLQEFIKKDEVRDVIRNMINEVRESNKSKI
ncbi:hypothetical protein HMPREF9711_03157 [Myroides odoratimimus CCUG 3837]|uniref:hypothetical protein n=1 Tax=Myroides odoratimimus TaxID=76832 RepID=UPI000280ACFC|nr:hypothetical protein [Myroides odoratimimus]EKB02372.1 hypothetical protein HMPREF9711_03157 [Myroides odoratimimus CCUG 3837]